MHKDKPPGLFDFAERGVRYLVGFWFTTGLVLSILVRTTILVMGDNAPSSTTQSADRLEADAAARRAARDPNKTQPPAPDAVRY
jgi:hypothetical protein